MTRCTRNEAHKMLEKAVSDCYAGKMMWDEFRKMHFEIIPLDLSAYPAIKDSTRKYIDHNFDREDVDKHGNYMLRGFIGSDIMAWYKDKENLNMNHNLYDFYYSGFDFNDEEMLIYTWCEGDTTLTLFSDMGKYLSEKAANEKWYRENV